MDYLACGYGSSKVGSLGIDISAQPIVVRLCNLGPMFRGTKCNFESEGAHLQAVDTKIKIFSLPSFMVALVTLSP
jgi:hypothetical protein